VPEPLPPAPLLGPKELLALGGLVLLQVWGWLNGRPKRSQYAPPLTGALETTGTVPPPGNTIGATLRIQRAAGGFMNLVNEPNCTPGGTQTTPAGDYNRFNVVKVEGPMGDPRGCGFQRVYYRLTYANGTTTNEGYVLGTANSYTSWTAGYNFTWNHPTAVPFENPVEVLPDPSGFAVPQLEPSTSPEVAPVPLPLPAPSTVPQVEPEVQPEVAPVETETETIKVPQIVRTTTVVAPQQQAPGAVTTQNGALPEASPAPVPTTDPTAVIPWPGASPIPGKGPAPAPTLEGIAQEVGRIERKIEVMMTPNAPGNLVDQLGDLADLIGPIIGAILAASSGTVYTLDSPCEVDEETGEKLPPVEVEAPGALTQFGAVLNRIDALAQLIQVHKNLKQPNCKTKPPTGEFVTVNFEQID